MKIYVAEFDTVNTESHGFGSSPSEAMSALLKSWKDNWSKYVSADPDLIDEYREEINVYEVELGKGYTIGGYDTFSRPIIAKGNEAQFDKLFQRSCDGPVVVGSGPRN